MTSILAQHAIDLRITTQNILDGSLLHYSSLVQYNTPFRSLDSFDTMCDCDDCATLHFFRQQILYEFCCFGID